jgi:hypothetical protein
MLVHRVISARQQAKLSRLVQELVNKVTIVPLHPSLVLHNRVVLAIGVLLVLPPLTRVLKELGTMKPPVSINLLVLNARLALTTTIQGLMQAQHAYHVLWAHTIHYEVEISVYRVLLAPTTRREAVFQLHHA